MPRRTSGRIKLPLNPKDILNLAQKIYQKHVNDGAASPLHNMENNPWDTLGPEIMYAQAKHEEAEEYRRKMEEAYRERDKHVPRYKDLLRGTAALLKALFRTNPKRLGEWHFDIDDSVPVKKADTKA